MPRSIALSSYSPLAQTKLGTPLTLHTRSHKTPRLATCPSERNEWGGGGLRGGCPLRRGLVSSRRLGIEQQGVRGRYREGSAKCWEILHHLNYIAVLAKDLDKYEHNRDTSQHRKGE
jgi:hypothetical protein